MEITTELAIILEETLRGFVCFTLFALFGALPVMLIHDFIKKVRK